MLRLSQDGSDIDSLTTDQLPGEVKNYSVRIRDLYKQLASAELQLLEEKEINTYLELIVIFLRENKPIPNLLWSAAMKGNEENVTNYRSSPRAMRRKSSFCRESGDGSSSPDSSSKSPIIPPRVMVDNVPALLLPQDKSSPRSQLLSSLTSEESEITAAGLSNLQIVDIIRDAVTRKSLKMTTLQNTIYDLRERINDEERKGQRLKQRMEKLGLTPRR